MKAYAMAPKLVRCIEGHVFDTERQAACPVCGAPAPQQPVSQPASNPARTGDVPSGGTNSGDKGAPLFPLPRVSTRHVGGGAAALALLIFAGYWAHHHDDVPAASPPVAQKDEGAPKSATSTEPPAEQMSRPAAENADAAPHKKIHINPDAIRHDDTATSPSAAPSGQKSGPTEPPSAEPATQPQQSPANIQETTVAYPPAPIRKIQADLKLSNTVVDIAQFKQYWTSFAAKPDRASLAMLEAVTLSGGIPQGAFTLFEAYSRGIGVNKDYDAALKFLRMAADQHNTIALTTLGSLNQFGRLGVPQNIDAAREFYRVAARQGSDEALEKFTALGGDPKSIKPTSPELVEWALQKKRSVVEPAMKAAAEKVLGADCALAIYSIQTNNKKATPELVQVLEQEARLGVGDASVYLAQIYEGGFGIDVNPAEALAWNGIIYADLTDADLKQAVGDTINKLASKLSSSEFDSLTFVEPWLGPFKPGVLR